QRRALGTEEGEHVRATLAALTAHIAVFVYQLPSLWSLGAVVARQAAGPAPLLDAAVDHLRVDHRVVLALAVVGRARRVHGIIGGAPAGTGQSPDDAVPVEDAGRGSVVGSAREAWRLVGHRRRYVVAPPLPQRPRLDRASREPRDLVVLDRVAVLVHDDVAVL